MSEPDPPTDWDERFSSGSYPRDPEPSPVLCEYEPSIPDGRALDLAAGTGRNAVFLAESGYDVDALDASREGLRITRERAAEREVDDRLETIHADATEYDFPTAEYDLITVSFYHTLDRFADLTAALVEGGYLFVEGHLRSVEPTPSGPSTDRYQRTVACGTRVERPVLRRDDPRAAGRPPARDCAAARLSLARPTRAVSGTTGRQGP